MRRDHGRAVVSGRSSLLSLAAILAITACLRGPIVSVAPVLDLVSAAYDVSPWQAGLLTSLPVVMFAFSSPLAPILVRRFGLDRVVYAATFGIALCTGGRWLHGYELALAGSALLGLAIGIGNVAVPMVIGRDCADRAEAAAAGLTTAFNLGCVVTLAATAPLASLVGWRLALSVWALPTLLATAWWAMAPRRGGPAPMAGPTPAETPLLRTPFAWALLVVFAGQNFSYYAISTWLPTMLLDTNGTSAATAGLGSAAFQLFAIPGAIAVARLCRGGRLMAHRSILPAGALWLTCVGGLALMPSAWPVWSVIGGLAQGAAVTVVFLTLVRDETTTQSGRLSSFTQSGGYAISAAGPAVLGLGWSLSGGWYLPLGVVMVVLVAMIVGGLIAIRHQQCTPTVSAAKNAPDGSGNA